MGEEPLLFCQKFYNTTKNMKKETQDKSREMSEKRNINRQKQSELGKNYFKAPRSSKEVKEYYESLEDII